MTADQLLKDIYKEKLFGALADLKRLKKIAKLAVDSKVAMSEEDRLWIIEGNKFVTTSIETEDWVS